MYTLEPYDHLAKRRAILNANGNPVAWVDYDDVGKDEADDLAERMLQGLNGYQSHEARIRAYHRSEVVAVRTRLREIGRDV